MMKEDDFQQSLKAFKLENKKELESMTIDDLERGLGYYKPFVGDKDSSRYLTTEWERKNTLRALVAYTAFKEEVERRLDL